MSDIASDSKTWFAGVLFLAAAGFAGYSMGSYPAEPGKVKTASQPATGALTQTPKVSKFIPPGDDKIPDTEFGKSIRLGQAIFYDTQNNAKEFIGNSLQCSNCHLDKGRQPDSAPLWAAYLVYPAYREKNGHVNTFQERLQGCFEYSMNGKAPPLGDKTLVALESYAYFLAKGAPTGTVLPGQGYPKLPKPDKFDFASGKEIYSQKCALCHGADGSGQQSPDGQTVFPPLWGSKSYNWGAGMSSINNAAGFIKANMPLSQGNTLTDKQAWDVAAYIDSQERPQDPRFKGSLAETQKEHHGGANDLYGTTVGGVTLGKDSVPSGPLTQ
jgi:thiosulfate dehydrogenase